MQLKCRDVKKIAYLIGTLGFLVCIHIASVYVFAVHRFSVTYDPILTAQACHDIREHLEHIDVCSLSAQQLAQSMRQHFTCIETVTCRYIPNGMLHITVHAQQPFIKLDDARLVTFGNYLVPADYYVPYALQKLPMLHLSLQEDEQRLLQDIFNFIMQLDQELLAQGAIIWKHRNEIQLNVYESKLQILCNDSMVPSRELLNRCAVITQELKAQLAPAQCILADVRFADQIIISKIKG